MELMTGFGTLANRTTAKLNGPHGRDGFRINDFFIVNHKTQNQGINIWYSGGHKNKAAHIRLYWITRYFLFFWCTFSFSFRYLWLDRKTLNALWVKHKLHSFTFNPTSSFEITLLEYEIIKQLLSSNNKSSLYRENTINYDF